MRRIGSSVAILVFVAACGGGSAPSTTVATAAPTTTVTSPSTTETPTTVVTTTTTTVPATTTTLKADIAIEGSDEFAAHTHNALALLRDEAAEMYAQVITHVAIIKSVAAGSGMHVETKTFDVGQETAYAPDWDLPSQVLWYAGAIVHDSCHSRLYADGEPHLGKEAEIACLEDQLAALEAIDPGGFFSTYVTGLIEGADDPENQYWNDPNRHW